MSGTFLAGARGFSTLGPCCGHDGSELGRHRCRWFRSVVCFAWVSKRGNGGVRLLLGESLVGRGWGPDWRGLASVAAFLGGGDGTKEMFERVVLKGIPSVGEAVSCSGWGD